jgi:hypothetical protein
MRAQTIMKEYTAICDYYCKNSFEFVSSPKQLLQWQNIFIAALSDLIKQKKE